MKTIVDLFFDSVRRGCKAAILMSGKGGGNAINILNHRAQYQTIQFGCVLSNNPEGGAAKVAELFGLESIIVPGKAGKGFDREEYFQKVAAELRARKIEVLIYAGWMLVSPDWFCKEFPGVNMHPADLRVVGENGLPLFTGMPAIKKTLDSGRATIASTMHVVEASVDCGRVIAVSKEIRFADLPDTEIETIHQVMKVRCEHPTYPAVLAMIADGTLLTCDLPVAFRR